MSDHEQGVTTTDPIVTEARKRWKRCAEAEDPQRKQILEAKEFRAGNQWPDDIKIQRQGGAAIQGQAAQPPRPCLTIDRLSSPVRQISNQIKTANFAIDVLPNGNGADVEVADIYKGILRRIQNQARAESPVEWAADGAIEGGIGWFRLRTDYVYHDVGGQPGPEMFDQEIKLERILNNLTVYCDPSAVKPTRSDARFMFVTEDLPADEYRRRYPKTKLASLDFATTGDTDTWVTDDMVRIAEYWRIEDAEETVFVGPDGTVQTGEAPKGAKTRTVPTPKVKCSIINGVEVIGEYEWVGSHIPLIPVLGEELNVDGRAVLRGVITEGMDAQRMVNYMYSAAIETVALAPKAPFVIAEGQLEGYSAIWQNLNRFNYSYAPYKPTSLNGTPVPPPQRDNAEPAIQAMVLMLQKSEEAIKATTGIHDPSLGRANTSEKSGRAIQALQAQGELGSSNYADNVRRALIYAGEQMVEVLPKITRPGQIMTILGLDDEPTEVVVGQPFIEQDGKAVPQPGMTPEQVKAQEGIAKFYDLKKGTYAVAVSVAKSHTTRREEGVAALGELIPHLPPPMAAAITPDFIEQMSFPGAHKIAETARRALPPELRPPDGKQDPSAMQAQIAQMGAMVQELQGQLQQAGQIIQTEQVKAQAGLQETSIKEQAENERTAEKLKVEQQIAALKAFVELAKAEISAQSATAAQHTEMAMSELGYGHEHAEKAAEREHESVEGDKGRQHEAGIKRADAGVKGEESERARQFQREEGEAGRSHEADQAERDRQIAAQQAEDDGA